MRAITVTMEKKKIQDWMWKNLKTFQANIYSQIAVNAFAEFAI